MTLPKVEIHLSPRRAEIKVNDVPLSGVAKIQIEQGLRQVGRVIVTINSLDISVTGEAEAVVEIQQPREIGELADEVAKRIQQITSRL